MKLLLVIILSLSPQLGQSCSCVGFSNRLETFQDGVCWGDVYSGVVVGATCSCRAADNLLDCREYSRNGDSYSSRVLTRVKLNTTNSFVDYYLKTCTQAGNILSPGMYCCIIILFVLSCLLLQV